MSKIISILTGLTAFINIQVLRVVSMFLSILTGLTAFQFRCKTVSSGCCLSILTGLTALIIQPSIDLALNPFQY